MKLNWDKYWYDLGSSVLKHIGTAVTGWTGINVANASGVAVPALDWKALGIFIIAAGIIPAIASFWQRQPLPEVVVEETTIKISKSTPQPEPIQPPNPATEPPEPPKPTTDITHV